MSEQRYLIPEPGHFFIQETQQGLDLPKAFVVEANQYAVIFTKEIAESNDGDETGFDWDKGVSILSIEKFNDLLREPGMYRAQVADADVQSALRKYQKAKKDPTLERLYRHKLPEDQLDYHELQQWEALVAEGIYPPPQEYREVPGAHWFYSGISDSQFVILFWSPAQQRYVMANGEPDPKALTLLRDGGYFGPVIDAEPIPEGKVWDPEGRIFVTQ